MKKTIASLLAVVVSLAVATGAEAKTTLRFATDISRADTQGQGAEHFIDLVSKKTNGEIVIKFYPDSTLGNTQAIVSGTRGGTIDIGMVGAHALSGLSKDFSVLDIPFIFKDKDHAHRALDGKVGQELFDTVKSKGIVGLAYFENGFRNITNNNKPIKPPDDVKGLKIRVPQSQILVKTFEALGANPVPMAFGELYTAMETGAIDSQDHPMPALYSGKFYEVQKYLSLTNHAYTAVAVVMNKKKFDKLTDEQQKIIVESAREAAKFQRDLNNKSENDMISKMNAESGIVVNDDVQKDLFVEKTKSIRDEYINANGDYFVKLIEAERKQLEDKR